MKLYIPAGLIGSICATGRTVREKGADIPEPKKGLSWSMWNCAKTSELP